MGSSNKETNNDGTIKYDNLNNFDKLGLKLGIDRFEKSFLEKFMSTVPDGKIDGDNLVFLSKILGIEVTNNGGEYNSLSIGALLVMYGRKPLYIDDRYKSAGKPISKENHQSDRQYDLLMAAEGYVKIYLFHDNYDIITDNEVKIYGFHDYHFYKVGGYIYVFGKLGALNMLLGRICDNLSFQPFDGTSRNDIVDMKKTTIDGNITSIYDSYGKLLYKIDEKGSIQIKKEGQLDEFKTFNDGYLDYEQIKKINTVYGLDLHHYPQGVSSLEYVKDGKMIDVLIGWSSFIRYIKVNDKILITSRESDNEDKIIGVVDLNRFSFHILDDNYRYYRKNPKSDLLVIVKNIKYENGTLFGSIRNSDKYSPLKINDDLSISFLETPTK